MADDAQDSSGSPTQDWSSGAAAMQQGADAARTMFEERVMDPAQRASDAMKQSGQRMVEGGSTIGARIIDQAESNANQAFAAMRAAAQAKDLAEVLKVQGDYLREQSTRSMTQAREIGELIMQFGRNAVTPPGGTGAS